SVWQRPLVSDRARDAHARRQANAAVVLLLLGRPDRVWPLLHHDERSEAGEDPRRRTYLIHPFAAAVIDPRRPVAEFLTGRHDASVRRALLLGLGEYPRDAAGSDLADELNLRDCYRTDPDAGLHAAAEWLLRRWGHGDAVRQIEAELSAAAA